MKNLTLIFLLFTATVQAQPVENLLLTTYSGNGKTTDTAYSPTIVLKYGIKFEDITSVELADSVGLVVIKTEYDALIAPLIDADTTCFVLSRDSALNNRGRFIAFLAKKKNGKRLSDVIGQKPSVDFNDIIAELRKIDREKKPKLKNK